MASAQLQATEGNWEDIHSIVRRFAQSWLSGRRPSLRRFLDETRGHPRYAKLAFLLARTDLNQRLLAGDDPPLEELLYVLEEKGVRLDKSRLLDLIRLEYDRRWWRGEPSVSRTEYQERFPEYREAVAGWTPLWTCPACKREAIPLPDEGAITVICPNPKCQSSHVISEVFRVPAELAQLGLDVREYVFDEKADRIGGGGMGAVYRSRDPGLGRELAIKVIRKELHGSREGEWRFVQEAKITSRLEHPNIVPVHSIGRLRDGQRLFYTMKLVRGQTLEQKLAACGPGVRARLGACLDDFERVCQAVAYAHQQGVIHRDLKPSNIMVGEFGQVQVMDWGLAKRVPAGLQPVPGPSGSGTPLPASRAGESVAPADLTPAGGLLGTPLYAAPEQFPGGTAVGKAADVFALGGLLCEILTGYAAYSRAEDSPEDPSLRGRIEALVKGDAVWPGLERLAGLNNDREFSPHRTLTQMAGECLARDPAARPPDAGALAQWVADYQAATRQEAEDARIKDAKLVEERKKKRFARLLAIVLTASLLSAAIAALFFKRQSDENANLATSNGQLADEKGRLFLSEQKERKLAESRLLTAVAQNLATHVETGAGSEYRQDELRALLARQAYVFHQRGNGTDLHHIDGALRRVLQEPLFVTAWPAHPNRVHACGLSDSGKLAATVGIDESVFLWDLSKNPVSRRELHPPGKVEFQHGQFPGKVSFTENEDTLVVVGPNRVRAWQLPSGKAIIIPQEAAESPIASFERHEKLLAIEAAGKILLYRITPRGLEDAGKFRLGKSLLALAIQPRGPLLASLDENGVIRIADRSKTGKILREIKSVDMESLRKCVNVTIDGFLDFLPDGTQLLSAFGAGALKTNLPNKLPGNLPKIADPKMAAQLEGAISVPKDIIEFAQMFEGNIKIWDIKKANAAPVVIPHTGILSWSLSTDGRWLAVASLLESMHSSFQQLGDIKQQGPQAFWLYDLKNPQAPPQSFRGDKAYICAVSIGPIKNNQIATGNIEGEMRLFESRENCEPLIWRSDREKTNVILLGMGKKMLVGDDTVLNVFSTDTPYRPAVRLYPSEERGIARVDASNERSNTEMLLYHNSVLLIATSSSPSRFFTSNFLNQIQEWDLDASSCSLYMKFDRQPIHLALSQEGRKLAVIAGPDVDKHFQDGECFLWADTTNKSRKEVLPGRWVSAEFSPDGTCIATTDLKGKVAIWEIGKSLREPLAVFKQPSIASQTRKAYSGGRWTKFSHDGKWLASCTDRDTILVWDVESRTLKKELIGSTDIINALCFSPSDDLLAAICDDGSVHMWSLRGAFERPLHLTTHAGVGRRVTFSATGSRLFACWGDGTITAIIVPTDELAQLAGRRVRRNLTDAEWNNYVGVQLPYEKTVSDLP